MAPTAPGGARPPFIVECGASPRDTGGIVTRLLSEGEWLDDDDRKAILIKTQVEYLSSYAERIGAHTIVCENHYVDRDYLEDYAGFYSRCFKDYQRFCRRIHFFTNQFDDAALRTVLNGTAAADAPINATKLKSGYRGFVVIRPLPHMVIGRTCLSTEWTRPRERHFPVNRLYKVDLFGLDLQVQTLAFQEQDRAVAACATSALWSVFQATSHLYQHPLPSPVEVTREATKANSHAFRSFPNGGLSAEQQALAIRSVGLDPHFERGELDTAGGSKSGHLSINKLKAVYYAYMKAKIPTLLSCEMLAPKDGPLGFHAVAGVGYRFGDSPDCPKAEPIAEGGPNILATRIEVLYVHDDQVGPFCRLQFKGDRVVTSWPHREVTTKGKGKTEKLPVTAKVRQLIFPLYHKVRSSFVDIYRQIVEFDGMLKGNINNKKVDIQSPFPGPLIWDIYLAELPDFRRSIRDDAQIPAELRLQLLTRNMPRFIWRATLLAGDTRIGDLMFDATDLPQGTHLCAHIAYDRWLCAMARAFENQLTRLKLTDRTTAAIIHAFASEAS